MRDCFPTVHSVSCGPVTTLWRGSHTAQWVLLIMVSCLYISFLMLPFSVNKLSFPYLRTKLSTNLNIVNACDLKSRVADSGLIDRPPGVWFSEQFSVTLLHLLAAVFSALCSSCCLPPAIFSVVRGILKRLTWRGDSCPFRMTHVSVSRKFIYYLTMYPCVPKQVGVCPSSLQSYKKCWLGPGIPGLTLSWPFEAHITFLILAWVACSTFSATILMVVWWFVCLFWKFLECRWMIYFILIKAEYWYLKIFPW